VTRLGSGSAASERANVGHAAGPPEAWRARPRAAVWAGMKAARTLDVVPVNSESAVACVSQNSTLHEPSDTEFAIGSNRGVL